MPETGREKIKKILAVQMLADQAEQERQRCLCAKSRQNKAIAE